MSQLSGRDQARALLGLPPKEPKPPTTPGKKTALGRAKPRKHLMIYLLQWLMGSLLGLLALLVLVTALMLGTQTGLRLGVDAAERWMPGEFRVEVVEGRLLDRARIQGLRLVQPGLSLHLGQLDLDWSPQALLSGRLLIRELAAERVDLRLAAGAESEPDLPEPNQAPAGPLELPRLVLPIAVDFQRLRIKEASYGSLDAEPQVGGTRSSESGLIRLAQAELSASLIDGDLQLDVLQAQLTVPNFQANASGEARLEGDYPISVGLNWRFRQAPAIDLTGEGRLEGDLRVLRLDHQLRGSAVLDLDARIQDLLSAPAWNAEVQLSAIDLPDFAAEAPDIQLIGDLQTQGDLESATATGQLTSRAPESPEFGELDANLDLRWANRRLDLEAVRLLETGSNALVDLKGWIDLSQGLPEFSVQGDWNGLRWPLFGQPIAQSEGGKLNLEGSADDYGFKLNASLQGEQLPAMDLALKGTGDQQAVRVAQLELDSLSGQILGKGQVGWAPEINWDLALTGSDLDPGQQWPQLAGKLGFKTDSRGSLAQGYGLSLRLDANLRDYPPAKLNLTGAGSDQSLEIESLELTALEGRISGTGQLSWSADPAWQAALDLQDLNPGVLAPDWPGLISARLQTQGQLASSGPDASVLLTDLSGQLRDYPIEANADVQVKGEQLEVKSLQASSGSARLDAKGILGQMLDFQLAFNAPNLADLVPDGQGRLSLDAKLGGTLERPLIRLNADAQDAVLLTQRIGRLGLKTDLDLSQEGPLVLDLQASGLELGGQRIATVTLIGDGQISDHRIRGDLQSKLLALQLETQGRAQLTASQPRRYSGAIVTLNVQTSDFGDWDLSEPAPLAIGEQIVLGPLCLSGKAETTGDVAPRPNTRSNGCLRLSRDAAGAASLSLDWPRLALASFAHLLPDSLSLEGALEANADLEIQGSQLSGTARLALDEGALRIDLPDASQRLVFSGSRLDLTAANDRLQLELDVPVQDLGGLKGQVSLATLDLAALSETAIQGGLVLDIGQLAPLAVLAPDLDAVDGRIDADLSLAGNLQVPVISGQLAIQELGLEVPLYGVRFDQGRLSLDLDSSGGMSIDGQARFGDQLLQLRGSGSGLPSTPSIDLQLQGEQLLVADSQEYRVVLSPDLEIGYGPQGAAVLGQIEIPEARIAPRSIPAGAVEPSEDIVRQDALQPTTEPLPIKINVQSLLGDQVQVDAFGLVGRIAGNLRVIKAANRPLLGDGSLEVFDGTYRIPLPGLDLVGSIGEPLTIQRGLVVYSYSPLDNPGLLLNAQRAGGDLTAGVRVLGTLKDPKLAFFSDSDPDMTQAEIIQYLVTGIPPKREGALGGQGLSVGTYVSPKLFLEYESSMNADPDKVKLRYQLTPKIQLQTETGEGQGADIFYQFEN